MHSELLRGEFNWFHQQKEQIHTDNTPQIHEERNEKINVSEQLELIGMVWKLQALVDERRPHLCRPPLPHPRPQMIPRKLNYTIGASLYADILSWDSELCAFNPLSR